jgi:TatD DNase family protein
VWTDSHCHVPWEGVGVDVIDEARDAGVTRLITVGTDVATSAAALQVAHGREGVWATVGLHPHEASAGADTIVGLLAGEDSLVAVGECGLDYFYEHSPREAQKEAFAAQIALAKERGLALVVHSRDAWDDTFDILRAEGAPDRWVLHCFTGGPPEARRGLDMGAMLSFSGIVTFRNAGEIREAAAVCPLDRMLVETDSPFLAPVPHRGRTNTPAFVTIVGAAVADAAGLPVETVERATWDNAERLFRLREPTRS